MSTSKEILRRGAVGASLAAVAWSAALSAQAVAAPLSSPIRAVFLKEFSKTNYTMNRGDLLVLENDDPFLAHAIGGSLFSYIAQPGKIRLVRNSPYLAPGDYPFTDPLNPGMNATLTVNPGASPAPDTAPPQGKAKILHPSAKKLSRNGKLRVRLRPTEAVDADVTVKLGKRTLAATSAAFAEPANRVISVVLPKRARRRLAVGTVLRVKITLTDVTGKITAKKTSARLGGGKKTKK